MLVLKTYKVYVYIAFLIALFVYAAHWHSGRIQEAKDSVIQEYTQEYVKDIEQKLKDSQQLALSQKGIIDKHEKTIDNINSRLSVAISSLSDRPSRAEAEGTNPSGSPSSCENTGRTLSREDAEFLTREAARAEVIQSERNEIYELYNSVLETINKQHE